MPTRSIRTAVIAGLASLAVLLGACAAPADSPLQAAPVTGNNEPIAQLDVLEDPRSYVGESIATLSDSTSEPLADNPAQELPATVTSYDHGGQSQVEVTDTSRVITMDIAGSIATTAWALGFGDTLVGRDQSTSFPGSESLPRITGEGHTVNSEAILGLAPTLIITDGSIGPRDVVEQLRDVGITVIFVDNEASFDGAASLALQVAKIFGTPDLGEQLAEQISAEIEAKIAEIAELAPKDPADQMRVLFLYLRGTSGIYYLFGDESGADDLISGLGAIDVAGEMGWKGMRPMTDEALIQANPDLILVMSHGLESVGGVDGLLESKPAIALTDAGKNRRFVSMDDRQVLSFGPRTADILDALARAIYAPEAAN